MKGILLLSITIFLSGAFDDKFENERWIAINWTDNLVGDFSFRNDWSYPDGVSKNTYGQLICEGICPPEIETMIDPTGKIYHDSLTAYYQIVDTTHKFHSIKSDAWTYEYWETNFINFSKQSDKTIFGQTSCNVSTHSSLNIKIQQDSITAWIEINSITGKKRIFPINGGSIEIDKKIFEQNIVKAKFDFTFLNPAESRMQMYWSGLIYCDIK